MEEGGKKAKRESGERTDGLHGEENETVKLDQLHEGNARMPKSKQDTNKKSRLANEHTSVPMERIQC